MGLFTQDLVDRRTGPSPASLVGDESEYPAGFPYARWSAQAQMYIKYWDRWSGARWDETVPNIKDDDGNPVPKYPIKANYLAVAAKKHAAMLIGDTPDLGEPAVPARIRPKKKTNDAKVDEAALKDAKDLEAFINDVWEENAGSSIQQEAALLCQVLGGIFLGARPAPNDPELENGIRLEYVLPDFCLPIWDTGHPDNLLEIWIVWRVPYREAQLRFGYDSNESEGGGTGPLYVEHWTQTEITVTVGKQVVKYGWGDNSVVYDHAPNPFGLVPFVYIPRRRAGSYYGISLVEDIDGLDVEMNSKLAYLGDIIQDTAQDEVFVRDLPSNSITRVSIGKGKEAVNLGRTPPGQEKPDVLTPNPPHLPEGLASYPGAIQKIMEHQSGVPSIAFGEDQGSQRSGMTLITRFWSITSEAVTQRNNWKVGLRRFHRIICTIGVVMKAEGITFEKMRKKSWLLNWAPMLPKDREQLLNEGLLLNSTNGVHPATITEKMEWVEDPWAEYEKAMEHLKRKTDIETEAQMKMQEQAVKLKTPTVQGGASDK